MYGPKKKHMNIKNMFKKIEEANFGIAKVVVHDVLTSQVTKLIKVGQEKISEN